MTNEARFDRQLPALLEDLYMGPSPDYRDEVLAAATAKRQRPAWTFPGRWTPMADIASRPAFVPRTPWRAIGTAVIVIALLLALAVAFVGSRQTKVPPPFGPARNGQVVYAAAGDIFAGDPVAGTSRAIVIGPEMDGNPRFSPDGTRVAFMRQVAASTDSFDLVVANADGSRVKVLSPTHLDTDGPYEWSPDGSFIVFTDSGFRVLRFDAEGATPPVTLLEDAYVQPGEFRPPNGTQILYEPHDGQGMSLWVMNADGSDAHPLYEVPQDQVRDGDFGSVRYSPDGTKIAFLQALPGDTSQLRVFVMNADGSDVHQLSREPGTWTETDLVWSPDGTHITFDRWLQDQATLEWKIQPLGTVALDGDGTVTPIGPTPVSDGAWFDYSPDGTALIAMPGTNLGSPATAAQPITIDILTGQTHPLDWRPSSVMTWQRLAD